MTTNMQTVTVRTSAILADEDCDIRPAWAALSELEDTEIIEEWDGPGMFLTFEDDLNDIAAGAGEGQRITVTWDGKKLVATCGTLREELWSLAAAVMRSNPHDNE